MTVTAASQTTPLISVVVPCWNVEKYAAKCVESLLAQTYRNLEILLVDDCSTDSTLSILKSLAMRDDRIRVIARESNGGLGTCRNSGIQAARGDLISFIDGDDTLAPDAYEQIALQYDPAIDVYWFGMNIIYESNHELQKSDEGYYRIRHEGLHSIPHEDLLDYDCSACNKVFKRELLVGDYLFKGSYYEDALFFMKFFASPRKIFFIKKKLYNYYRHPTSIMASTFNGKEGLAIHHLFILDDIRDFWLRKGFLPASRIAFQRIVIAFFWFAYEHSLPFERARVVAEMVDRVRKWNIGSEANPVLDFLRKGEYTVTFGPTPPKAEPTKTAAVISMPPLKGMQKLFAIRNENGHQIVRVLTKKIASRKVKNVSTPDKTGRSSGTRGS